MSTCYAGASSFGDVGSSLKDFNFAVKKYGRDGKQIPIYANFFPIKVNCQTIYHYNIDIQVHDFIREKDDKNVPQRNKLMQQKKLYKDSNFAVFERFVKQETKLFSSEPIFDGFKNLYTKTKINIQDKAVFQVKQKIQEKKFPIPFDITITIPKDSHELDMTVLNDKNVKNAEKELQALDIILSYGPKRYKLAVGHNLFMRHQDLASLSPDMRKKIRFNLGEMKEVSFGHYQSAKLTEMGTQLNIDRAAIVFNKGGNLINLIEQLCTEMRSGPPRRDAPPPRQVEIDSNFRLNQNERNLLNTELKNLNFIVTHISYQPKNKIFCITEKSVSEIFFEQRTRDSDETTKVSVKDYFEKVYSDYLDKSGRRLLGNLPCVQVGKNNPKYFPLEVVTILHDQYNMKKLKPKFQSEMTRTCGQQRPPDRFREGKEQVKSLIGTTSSNETDYLKYFDIKMDVEYTQANGRVLDPASLLFGENKVSTARDGQWRADSYVIPACDIKSDWMVINYVKDYNNPIRFAPKKDDVDGFVRAMKNFSKNFGLNLHDPCEIIYDEVYRGRADLEDAMADFLQDHQDLKMFIFIIPKIDELYSNIKFLSEINYGVVTQCVAQDKTRQFSQASYISNLLLKVNAKLGGTNVHLNPKCKIGHLKKKTMIMGLDVTHPSTSDRLGNSIAAVVSTFDSKMVNYFSKCVVQPKPKAEIILLDEICVEMLENFRKEAKILPDYLLIYRDGVSDGQFAEVIEKELNLIKQACSKIDPGYKPKITFIVVQKRHHTRFLPVNERDRIAKSQNVLPGTIIDNSIVSNYYFEFFLSAHYGALGTTRPTRYTVLHDESEFSGDDIQKTTYLLSYLFPRCPKSVSVPPPVLFAHLAAKRARSYLFTLDNNRGQAFGEAELTPSEIKALNSKIEVNPNLKNILYFV